MSHGGGDPDRGARPVRLAHLGLGAFFRAHQAWYTDRAADGPGWGIAAFSGRGPSAAVSDLAAAGGAYHLVVRGAQEDRIETVRSLASVHAGSDAGAWTSVLADPAVTALTLTVTEAGYLQRPDGGLDLDRAEVRADLAALRAGRGDPVVTAPGRILTGLAARRRADAGPIAVVPCDNLAGNADAARAAVSDLAAAADTALADWLGSSVRFVGTVVDRITPRATPEDLAAVAALTGAGDPAAVVTEPFAEWVLGDGLLDSPDWVGAGALRAVDLTPFEDRKLRLLNGAHSLLAYTAPALGHVTVADAMGDDTVVGWLEEWWADATATLGQPAAVLAGYREALSHRFANPRIRHLLAQVAADGSRKLPQRVLPVLDAGRARGRLPLGATRILAGWLCHLRGLGAAVSDVDADLLVPSAAGAWAGAARVVLDALRDGLGHDADLVATVVAQAEQLAARAG